MNVVGSAFYHRPGCASKAMAALASEGISLRMMDQGASEINITLGVAPEEFEPAIRAIYRAFVG
jgi:aspartate kinase